MKNVLKKKYAYSFFLSFHDSETTQKFKIEKKLIVDIYTHIITNKIKINVLVHIIYSYLFIFFIKIKKQNINVNGY